MHVSLGNLSASRRKVSIVIPSETMQIPAVNKNVWQAGNTLSLICFFLLAMKVNLISNQKANGKSSKEEQSLEFNIMVKMW